eukprot:5645052-Ditylum_brightwellii.AAC.1
MVPVSCPIDGCIKVYYCNKELVTKLPKDVTTGLPNFFEYWGDHHGSFNLEKEPRKRKSFKGICSAIKNHCKSQHKMLLACCEKAFLRESN